MARITQQALFSHENKQRLISEVVGSIPGIHHMTDDDLRRRIHRAVALHYEGRGILLEDRRLLADKLFDAMRGLDVLQPLMDDPNVTEIMVNAPDVIYYEKNGKLMASSIHFDGTSHLTHVISRYFGQANRLINEQKPIGDMYLKDGSRVHAVLPPASPVSPILCIRRFTGIRPSMDELIRRNSLTQEAANFLRQSVQERKNIFISGGTGTGKTTFLNALSEAIPATDRVITIEDSLELNLQGIQNLVRLEARAAGPDGQGEISLSHLIRSSLRLRPDRIIVGEVRGEEAFDMIQSMATGHPGSMSTGTQQLHEMLDRLSL